MTMRPAIVDTDTLSYVFRGTDLHLMSKARQYVRIFNNLTVTVAEIVEGMVQAYDSARLDAFLREVETYEVLPIGTEEATLAGRIMGELAQSGQGIGDLDPFIAAVAITNGLPLVTNNARHYERIVSLGFPLELENWREPGLSA